MPTYTSAAWAVCTPTSHAAPSGCLICNTLSTSAHRTTILLLRLLHHIFIPPAMGSLFRAILLYPQTFTTTIFRILPSSRCWLFKIRRLMYHSWGWTIELADFYTRTQARLLPRIFNAGGLLKAQSIIPKLIYLTQQAVFWMCFAFSITIFPLWYSNYKMHSWMI